ncbi:MAG: hypothetical protein R3F61_11045 [Myxococcota bacterium]
MDMRWSHEGVSLRAPVRHARALRRAGLALLAAGALVTVGFFSFLAEPTAPVDHSICASHGARLDNPVCDAIRPSFETWRYASVRDYVHARACSLDTSFNDADLFQFTRASAGIGYAHNLNFLRMAANQHGDCPVEPAWREQATREFAALVSIENHYWSERIARADVEASATFARLTFVRRVLLQTVPLWLPVLALAWIVVLVAYRRLLRAAEPLELKVHTAGVELDGRRIPRSDIAFLSLEGQRLRVERWTSPPVFSRPLPSEALVHTDEICGALGLMDDDDTADVPAPASLRTLMARRAAE